MEIFAEKTVIIKFETETKTLFQKWTGFSTTEIFRAAIDKTVNFVANNSVKAILNDTTEQSVVKPEDTEYASSKMPTLFSNGLKAMAVIVPQNILTQMSLKKFENSTKGANMKFFSSKMDAQNWINNLS